MSARKWFRCLIGVIILLVGVVIAVVAGILFAYFLAGWASSIPILAASAVITVAAVIWTSAWTTARVWQLQGRLRFTTIATAVLAASFTFALYVLVLRPTPEVPITNFGVSAKHWQLPTGSQIAYYEYDPPSNVSLRSEPILFLHGGPGLAISPFEHSFFRQFATDGYRVYLYDQAGSGQSAFLPPRQYTVSRFVEDIEAIRQQIGAEKLILVGHSWGSTLAASYIAKYPERVSKVVFYSPGPIWNWTNYVDDPSRAAQAPFVTNLPLRLLAGLSLAENRDNPGAGEKLVSQRESETLYIRWIAPQAYIQVCKGDTRNLPEYMISIRSHPDFNPGFNPYVFDRLTDILINAKLDPHSVLRGNKTAAIILFSECDFIPWASSLDYRKTFPNSKVYYIPHAGHIVEFVQPEIMARIIRAFLLNEPDVIPPYMGDADPR
jgi:pimeloyl-ACP methyl ester carboxylesterase